MHPDSHSVKKTVERLGGMLLIPPYYERPAASDN